MYYSSDKALKDCVKEGLTPNVINDAASQCVLENPFFWVTSVFIWFSTLSIFGKWMDPSPSLSLLFWHLQY